METVACALTLSVLKPSMSVSASGMSEQRKRRDHAAGRSGGVATHAWKSLMDVSAMINCGEGTRGSNEGA